MSNTNDVLRALSRLARHSVWVKPPVDGSDAAKIISIRSGERREDGQLTAATWRKLVQMGLVVSEHETPYWRVSNAGRLKVKRARSQSRNNTKTAAQPKVSQSHCVASRRPKKGEVSLLHWLRQRRDRFGQPFISDAEFLAGERLQADFSKGQLMPRVTSSWSSVGDIGSHARPDAELSLSEVATDARQRVREALNQVGPEFAGVLIDVCCHMTGLEDVERKVGWPQRSGKIVLKLALSALARHYRIEQNGEAAGSCRGVIRQWGAQGYQPSLDQW